ncbi:unnamed protein product, partial [Scytosiphon promiscuus]
RTTQISTEIFLQHRRSDTSHTETQATPLAVPIEEANAQRPHEPPGAEGDLVARQCPPGLTKTWRESRDRSARTLPYQHNTMAGDASLGITPVMKWNFERSCYRWLVTRHPAQFERLDFTAQILQSASRARKAFYECGWAEAKVLIRPSDGKFERTPFFDAIIRRGLRNSTRFDASTLTEDEIEALGMHRDETLGFKLQIRHFRSNRKELPPQGRGGGGVRKQQQQQHQQQQQPTQQPQNHRLPGAAAMVAGRSLASAPSHSGGVSTRAPVASGVDQQQQQWGTEAAAVAAVAAATAARSNGDPRWADEARWHRAG